MRMPPMRSSRKGGHVLLIYLASWVVKVNGCSPGNFGKACNQSCPQQCAEEICDEVTADCLSCNTGWYGEKCSFPCPHQCVSRSCDQMTMECFGQCMPGYTGTRCLTACDVGSFGLNCSQSCPVNCLNGRCDKQEGHCLSGCLPGYMGPLCDSCKIDNPHTCTNKACFITFDHNNVCPELRYGVNCSQPCPESCVKGMCQPINGECLSCHPGRAGALCQPIAENHSQREEPLSDFLALGIVILICVTFFCLSTLIVLVTRPFPQHLSSADLGALDGENEELTDTAFVQTTKFRTTHENKQGLRRDRRSGSISNVSNSDSDSESSEDEDVVTETRR